VLQIPQFLQGLDCVHFRLCLSSAPAHFWASQRKAQPRNVPGAVGVGQHHGG
jgi:hypothetical protein